MISITIISLEYNLFESDSITSFTTIYVLLKYLPLLGFQFLLDDHFYTSIILGSMLSLLSETDLILPW